MPAEVNGSADSGGRCAPPTSPGGVLAALRAAAGLTRQELQARVGLSRATMVERIDLLQRHRLIRVTGRRASGGGRPADVLAVDDESRVALVADLGVSHLAVGVTTLGGRLLGVERERLSSGHRPAEVVPRMLELGRDLLTATGRRDDLAAFGLSLPGQIDQVAGTTVAPPTIPAWDGYRLREPVEADLGVPVLIDNDANALAFGEYLAAGRAGTTLLGVKVGTAIGAGIVIGDHPHRGATGCAGEIGHMRIEGRDELCSCGRRGCVAAIASGRALQRKLGCSAVGEIAERIQAGDAEAADLAREAGKLVGAVLATAITFFNPGVVRIGGGVGVLPPFVEGLRATVHDHAHAVALRGLDVAPATLDDRAALVGMAGLAAEYFFDPAAVDSLVGLG